MTATPASLTTIWTPLSTAASGRMCPDLPHSPPRTSSLTARAIPASRPHLPGGGALIPGKRGWGVGLSARQQTCSCRPSASLYFIAHRFELTDPKTGEKSTVRQPLLLTVPSWTNLYRFSPLRLPYAGLHAPVRRSVSFHMTSAIRHNSPLPFHEGILNNPPPSIPTHWRRGRAGARALQHRIRQAGQRRVQDRRHAQLPAAQLSREGAHPRSAAQAGRAHAGALLTPRPTTAHACVRLHSLAASSCLLAWLAILLKQHTAAGRLPSRINRPCFVRHTSHRAPPLAAG